MGAKVGLFGSALGVVAVLAHAVGVVGFGVVAAFGNVFAVFLVHAPPLALLVAVERIALRGLALLQTHFPRLSLLYLGSEAIYKESVDSWLGSE